MGKAKPVNRLLLLFCAASFLSACMSVKYDRMTPRTAQDAPGSNYGVPFYEGRPYLLVVNGYDAKGKPSRTISIITLPDLSKPYRAYIDGVFGKASLNLSLSNGVLTSTTATAEESATGVITAIAGVAKVPAEIAYTRAQAALERAKSAELSPERDAACPGKPTTRAWYEEIQVIQRTLATIDDDALSAGVLQLRRHLDDWSLRVCRSPELNFTAEPDALEIIQVKKFQAAVVKFSGELSGFRAKVKNLSSLHGCGEDSTCRVLRSADHRLKLLSDDMHTYSDPEPVALPPFELYEFKYDDTGIFVGLERRHPPS